MQREEIYDAWAPDDGVWSDWVKPVLFGSMPDDFEPEAARLDDKWLRLAARIAAAGPGPRGGELPGAQGVLRGIALSGVGYRPVPLYNAVPHGAGFVELDSVMSALASGAAKLAPLAPSAPPAFLLDSRRMDTRALPGDVAAYDNRSVARLTDFPSPSRLTRAGFQRALLIQAVSERPPTPDLEAVLLEWQRHGLELWRLAADVDEPARPFVLQPRPWFARARAWLLRTTPRQRRDGAYGRFWRQGS
ncbi:MAG: hypothetical protein K0R38_4966 [Polyangiaceae bacterium]|nr:hypothetical protein [Polyangiaceae bacterium]